MDMDISMDIHEKSVDMDMDMDVIFHIHGNPADDCDVLFDDGVFLFYVLQNELHYVHIYHQFVFVERMLMGEGGKLGQSYIILGGGLQNYYITLYGGGWCQKSTFSCYIICGRPQTYFVAFTTSDILMLFLSLSLCCFMAELLVSLMQ